MRMRCVARSRAWPRRTLGGQCTSTGRLQLHLLSWTPRVVVSQLRIANPGWVTARESEGRAAGAARPGAKAPEHAPTGARATPTDMVRIGELRVFVVHTRLIQRGGVAPLRRPGRQRYQPGARYPQAGKLGLQRQRPLEAYGAAGQTSRPGRPAPGLKATSSSRTSFAKLHFNGTVAADQAANRRRPVTSPSTAMAASTAAVRTAGHRRSPDYRGEPQALYRRIRHPRRQDEGEIAHYHQQTLRGSVVADLSASGDDLGRFVLPERPGVAQHRALHGIGTPGAPGHFVEAHRLQGHPGQQRHPRHHVHRDGRRRARF